MEHSKIFTRLMRANERYMATVDRALLRDTAENGQHPYATVVCCSDSRVVPEFIFDADIGDLFVIRVAGNVLDNHQIGSIEYAAGHASKTPNTKYLRQIEETAFTVLATDSEYPVFSSSYFIRRGETFPGRVNVALADPECHTDYYLVCLASERKKFERLFKTVSEDLIK